MATVTIKELIEAGVHFGHRASRWHPQMAPYIHGKHNQIHIIDLRETLRGLIRASHFLNRLTESGHDVIFVGTKQQARDLIREHADRSGMHFVATRWLGGTLTNFHTIRSRLKRLEELESWETDGSINLRSKKEISSLRRERRKIHRNLEGIRKLTRLPAAMVVIDIRRDHIAVSEAKLMGIPVVALVDTDCNPANVDLVVPGNDDAYRAIEIILSSLADSIVAGRDKLVARQEAEEKKRLEDETQERQHARSRAPGASQGETTKVGSTPGAEKGGVGTIPPAGNAAGETTDGDMANPPGAQATSAIAPGRELPAVTPNAGSGGKPKVATMAAEGSKSKIKPTAAEPPA